ncbi:putative leucine-rich repeat domain superfamily [Helianthus debilis subsp. tardiflorus]
MEQGSNRIIVDHTRSEIHEDYISKLPDELLRQILTIYPLDSGSKAVALFTGLWNRPYIKHGGATFNIQDFESVIGDFLVGFDENNPLKMPRKLEIHCSKGLFITASLELNRKLHLDFPKGIQEFPRQFGWEIVLNTMDLAHSSPYPFSVKTLKLTSVNYLSCELVSSLINKFRYVETLIIEKCDGLRSLRVEGLAKLTSLSVLDCVDLKSVYVEALELDYLRYSGFLCWFSLENLLYLKDVKLDFKGPGFNHLVHDLYNPLLRAIRDVSVLTLHGWMFKEVFGPLLSSKHNEQHFNFSKLEELWWIDSCMEDHNMKSLFHFLKFCTSLKRLFISIVTQSYSKSCERECSTEVQKGRLRKLKVVKMEGFEKEEDIILFKEHLMEVFNVEPRVVEVRKGRHDRCLLRIPKHQASAKATKSIKFKFSYRFVEEVEDSLSSKHPHMP